MFRHTVLLKLNDDATDDQRDTIREALAALPALIPEIESYTIGTNAGDRPDNFDFAVIGDFADKAAYQVYADHPDHIRVIQEHIAPLLTGRAAVQFEV
ncbi:MAG: Dabb family protein [Actinomycetota bacterium]